MIERRSLSPVFMELLRTFSFPKKYVLFAVFEGPCYKLFRLFNFISGIKDKISNCVGEICAGKL